MVVRIKGTYKSCNLFALSYMQCCNFVCITNYAHVRHRTGAELATLDIEARYQSTVKWFSMF